MSGEEGNEAKTEGWKGWSEEREEEGGERGSERVSASQLGVFLLSSSLGPGGGRSEPRQVGRQAGRPHGTCNIDQPKNREKFVWGARWTGGQP